jgi:MFS family permease
MPRGRARASGGDTLIPHEYPIITAMTHTQVATARSGATAIPWRVVPPLASTALIMIGAGVLGSLLPLRFSAMGYSPGVIGLFATAEALGFLVGCLYAHKIIAPVGLERAYAAFAGMKAVAILGLHFADSVPAIVPLRFLIGLNAAGLAIIVESWLNALVPNEQRGRVLTIYVLVYGLFFGAGQLLGQNLNVRGPELLFMAGIATTLALIPMVAIDVRAPVLPHGVKLEILKALRISPVSVLACLLNGLILTAFTTVGPLFGERIGFDQRHIVMLMACVSLGGLFLQWPIGSFSDRIDRRYALIGLGAGILVVAADHRNVRHPTHHAPRLLRLRDRADARVHAVHGLAPVPAQARPGRRSARGILGIPANLAGNLRVAPVSPRTRGSGPRRPGPREPIEH